MQKLVKRSAQAHRQASRRSQMLIDRAAVDARRRVRQQRKAATEEMRLNVRDARRERRENWELGPLAPKRDLGFNSYGVIKESMRIDWAQGGLARVRPQILEQRCAWAGGPKMFCLAVGDRVLVMDGPDKGKVDVISSIDASNGTLKLTRCHRALVEGVLTEGVRSDALPLSVASVRLVYPLRHPQTGLIRDVIINQLKGVPPNMQSENMTLDRWEHGKKYDRVVPGINVVIPWPEVKAPDVPVHDGDTVRDLVDARSFFFGLLSPPMPQQVIDELRNKYSKFRTRHEPWYLEKMEAREAAKKRRAETVESMRTPLDDFHAMQRSLRESDKEPELSEPMLERLGQIMAQRKTDALDSSGISEMASAAKPGLGSPSAAPTTPTRPRSARGGADS